ncbi:MAG: alpha/beta hydrolase [Planctomycetota bacterium]|nr:alpha/beta hydrolase [Planctomycetota bacterium]
MRRNVDPTTGRVTLLVLILGVAAPVSGGDVELKRELVYAERGGEELQLDLALPATPGKMRPAVVCIHGGGWRAGRREVYDGVIRALAEQGYVAATVSYRFTQKAAWPAQLDDVRDAVRWLRKHAETYGIDPQRIGAMGDSAGGHLSLLLGLLPDGKKGEDTRLQAVVNYYGPTDLTLDEFEDDVKPLIEALAAGKRHEKGDVYAAMSPRSYVTRTDSPVLTFHDTADRIVPVNQARVLHAALDAARIPNRLEILEGKGHGWGGADRSRTLKRTREFFDAYLKGSRDPLIAADDFSGGAGRWEPTDESAWKIETEGANPYYALVKARSDYRPPVRSPFNFALLKDVEVTDFVLDVNLRSTNRVYGHQDLCLFFGYQDPGHFYYVHLGRKADAHANSIFLVDGKPRVSIARERTDGTDWSRGWHRARVRRDVQSGRIEVFFDDLEKPVMITENKRFVWGRVGIGSFDDTGSFDAFRVWGREREK